MWIGDKTGLVKKTKTGYINNTTFALLSIHTNSGGIDMKAETKSIQKNKVDVKELVITALFIALVYVFTAFINVRLPIGGNGGLIHLGNIPLFIAAIVFGKKTGAIAGGVGMGLFDLLSGWVSWAPFTLVIVGLMGFTVGLITEKKERRKTIWYFVAIVAALLIKIVGYYFAEVILYSNFLVPLSSIPGNIIQVSFAGIITLLIVKQLNLVAEKTNLVER